MLNLVFDCIISIALVNNLDIFVWRIIWDTQDLYLQSNLYFNSIISLVIAYVLIFLVKCIQINEINSLLKRKYLCDEKKHQEKNSFFENLKIKLVIILISIANINHWRCLWNFTIEYTNKSEAGTFTLALIAFALAIFMKRLCSFVSSPFQIGTDSYDAAYGIQPSSANHNYYLNLKNNFASDLIPNKWQILLSFLFEFVSDICTIHSWRSFWYYLDLHLYVDDQVKSSWVSLGIGVLIYVIVHLLNRPINNYLSKSNELPNENSCFEAATNLDASENLIKFNDKFSPICHKFIKKILLHLLFVICFIGTVCTWRGVWQIQLIYCYPKLIESSVLNQNILNLFYFSLSIVILWKTNLLASLQSRSSCEDEYFMLKGNFILECENLKNLFGIDFATSGDMKKQKDFDNADYTSITTEDSSVKTFSSNV